MATIEQLVRGQMNPFDPATFKPGDFWREIQDPTQEVTSIHQEVLAAVEQSLAEVICDRTTRTLLLIGDSGSGKSHLLGRLKRQLNDRACFAYIGPWPDSQYIWRHVLRQTVDSLLAVPEGCDESQLIRWLKGLAIFQRKGMAQRLLGERNVFVRDMRASFPTLYRGKDFFNALYALLDPALSVIAADWLRGEDLDEEDRALIHVSRAVDSEDAAQKMLNNLGWVADSTQPIVICFDNLDNVPRLPNGKPDLKALFNVNSAIHNAKLKNFLIIISIITSNWRANKDVIDPPDLARLNKALMLRSISIDQAAQLWAFRLQGLHQQARPKPASPLAPLTKDWLVHRYPGGRVTPRSALILAEWLIKEFKRTGCLPAIEPDQQNGKSRSFTANLNADSKDPGHKGEQTAKANTAAQRNRASFELIWQKEFQETGAHLRRIGQFSSPELVRRLQEALEALEIPQIKRAPLPSPSYCSYSLGYQQEGSVVLVWTEDPNLNSFCHVMKACQKLLKARQCNRLYLIRKERLGTSKNKGYQLYQEIFSRQHKHLHLKPDKASVQYLETYHRLLNAAAGRELVVGECTPTVEELQALVRESGCLDNCDLLRQLSLVPESFSGAAGGNLETRSRNSNKSTGNSSPKGAQKSKVIVSSAPSEQQAATRYILNLMTTQSLMGLQALVETTQEHYPSLDKATLEQVIDRLCADNKLQRLDPKAKPENQLLCWVPATA